VPKQTLGDVTSSDIGNLIDDEVLGPLSVEEPKKRSASVTVCLRAASPVRNVDRPFFSSKRA
jgi:hypothetical protein